MMVPSAAALKDHYAELKLPVLVVTGDGDRIVDHVHQSLRLGKLLPNSRLLVLPGVGHMVHHIEPRRIAVEMSGTMPLLRDVA